MPKGYRLPTPLTGYEPVCVTFEIPNAPEYRQAVTGAIIETTKWYVWERTGGREAVDAAEYLRQFILPTLVIGECEECDEDDNNADELQQLADGILSNSIVGGVVRALGIELENIGDSVGFDTILPAIAITLLGGAVGGLINVLLDGVLAASVTVAAGEVVEVVLQTGAILEPVFVTVLAA